MLVVGVVGPVTHFDEKKIQTDIPFTCRAVVKALIDSRVQPSYFSKYYYLELKNP